MDIVYLLVSTNPGTVQVHLVSGSIGGFGSGVVGVISPCRRSTVVHDEWVYAWKESLFDDDGQLWVVTMSSLLIPPVYQEARFIAVLCNSYDYS